MRQMIRILLGMFLLTSISAFADSFTGLGVNFNVQPNNGSGGNIGGQISGQGVNFLAGGGTAFSWFNGSVGVAPGSIGGGSTTIFWEDAFGTLGSQTYLDGDIALDPSTLNAGSFTFPTNGQDFTVSVPASLDIITGTILATCNGVCQTVSLTTTAGTLTLSFFYSAADGMYYGTSGSFISSAIATVPEPATLGLMAMGVVAVTRRRLQQRRA